MKLPLAKTIFVEVMMKKVCIGIPAYNEEKNILKMLYSLKENILFAKNYQFSIHVILHKSTDNSHSLIKNMKWLNILKINNSQGKMSPLRYLLKNVGNFDAFIFIDADISFISSDVIKKLCDNFFTKDYLLIYPNIIPLIDKKNKLHLLLKNHYNFQNIYTVRNYFHGRCYIFGESIKSAFFYSHENKETSLTDKQPRVDDIFISRWIAHYKSVNVIYQCNEIGILFCPPKTIRDFYYGQFRLLFEMQRLDDLFPRLKYTQKKYFIRRVNSMKFMQLKFTDKFAFLSYIIFEKIIQIIVRVKLYITLGDIKTPHWKHLSSTKKLT